MFGAGKGLSFPKNLTGRQAIHNLRRISTLNEISRPPHLYNYQGRIFIFEREHISAKYDPHLTKSCQTLNKELTTNVSLFVTFKAMKSNTDNTDR